MDFLAGDEKLLEGGLVAALEAVKTGGRVSLGSQSNAFYGCAISANGGRLVIRDWWESSVVEVLEHVSEWIRDLAIVKLDGGIIGIPKFGALLYSMVREDLKELPPQGPYEGHSLHQDHRWGCLGYSRIEKGTHSDSELECSSIVPSLVCLC